MKPATILLAFLLLAVTFAPGLASAQAGPKLLLLHDVNDEGDTYVGNTVQFGYAILGASGQTTTHQDGNLRIKQNGMLIYETTGASAHDYDGIVVATVTFTEPGPYIVEAEGAGMTQTFEGMVRPLGTQAVVAEVRLDPPAGPLSADQAHTFTVGIYDEEGVLINHTDAIVEVYRVTDGALIFRTNLHTHTQVMRFDFVFPDEDPQDYRVTVIGHNAFPSKSGASFPSVTTSQVYRSGCPCTTAVPGPSGAPQAPARQIAADLNATVHATFDPEVNAFLYGPIRINGLVLNDDTTQAVAHVNGNITLFRLPNAATGTAGRLVFQSGDLHTYDGLFEVLYQGNEVGDYVMRLAATRGEWMHSRDIEFNIGQAGLPLAAGPGVVEVTGLGDVEAGVPSAVQFLARTPAGSPIMHSEVDFQVHDAETGAVLVGTKVHTHADGLFTFNLVVPRPGDYVLRLDPFTLEGEPVLTWDVNAVGNGRSLAFTAAGEAANITVPPVDNATEEAADVPGVGVPILLAMLAGTGIVARRRGQQGRR